MPQPTLASIRPFDVAASNMLVAYMQDENAFVATKVFPPVPVDEAKAKYPIFDRDDWFRPYVTKRASSTESSGSGFKLSNDSYECERYGLHKDADITDIARQQKPIDLEQAALKWLARQFLLKHEIAFQETYFVATPWTTQWAGVAGVPGGNQVRQWNDYANSTPIADVDAAKRAVLILTGFEPNTMVVGYDVWIKLKEHPDITSKYEHTQGGVMTEPLVAAALGIKNLLVSKAIQRTSAEGDTAVNAFICGKAALLCYVTPTPGLYEVSAGYTFGWTGNPGRGNLILGAGTTKFYMENITSWRYEGESWFDMKVCGADLGLFINTLVA